MPKSPGSGVLAICPPRKCANTLRNKRARVESVKPKIYVEKIFVSSFGGDRILLVGHGGGTAGIEHRTIEWDERVDILVGNQRRVST